MLNESMLQALNKQMNAEIYSAYLYLAMASYFDSINLPGFAHWMKKQAHEEMAHALKFYEFINDRGGRALFEAIPAPPAGFESPRAVFEAVLDHERTITSRINELYALARREGDYATETFLQWFISEQVEEEKSVADILHALQMIGEQGAGLLMLDHRLGSR